MTRPTKTDDERDDTIGRKIVAALFLRPVKAKRPDIRFATDAGPKSFAGLARTVRTILTGKEFPE